MRASAPLLVLLCVASLAGCVNQSRAAAAPAPTPAPNAANPYQPTPYVKLKHPEWAKNAVIYQINTRQFTPEGTFRAAEAHLPRLKELGVDILWLMPIHKIGEKNRKGTLGSPYSVKDYYSVNPEFGTLEDLKHFVAAAHAARLPRHPRLGRQPHRLGQQPRRRASGVVRPRLQGRLPPDAVVGLVGHHRPRLQARGAAHAT